MLHAWLQTPGGFHYQQGLLGLCPTPAHLAERIVLQSRIDPPIEYEVLIRHKPSHLPLGVARLSTIDFLNAKAELSLALFRGKGTKCALEAMAFSLEYPFLTMNLHKLIFHVDHENPSVMHLPGRFGAVPEGVLREEVVTASGSRIDLHRFALFAASWLNHPLRHRWHKLFPLSQLAEGRKNAGR